jgi:3-isopropylmalate dehydrogenase
MRKTIAVLPGDGIGREITTAAVSILEAIAVKFHHQFIFTEGLIGASAIEKMGTPFPDETYTCCFSSDAILFGAIGDPTYDNNPLLKVRPEQGLLTMRKVFALYANIRPIFTFKDSMIQSPLRSEVVKDVDFIVVRELVGGIYFGKHGRSQNRQYAFDTCEYNKKEIEQVAHLAFRLSRKRKKKVTLVDKANVLETSRLWRETVQEIAKSYPDIAVDFMFVDSAAMQLMKKPFLFDVILTDNMFGDILTDEASVITGSIGLLPSASIGEKISLYEPIHGSYPKAIKNTANPIGTILSAAMMLEYSFGLERESLAVFSAVKKVLKKGFGTKDIVMKNPLSTSSLAQKIREAI